MSRGDDDARRQARALQQLGPVAQLRAGRLPYRLVQLLVGLVLFGLTLSLAIRSTLGNAPWDVLHQGLARHLPISIGTAVIAMSVVVLLLWVPLREMPGVGTVANGVLVGLVTDVTLGLVPAPDALWLRVVMLLVAVPGNALATAMYIGSQLGPGPRDGLMTGLHRRTGVAIWKVRTGIEVVAVVVGIVLGGVFGVGTVLYAVAIGPLTQLMLPAFVVDLPRAPRTPPPEPGTA